MKHKLFVLVSCVLMASMLFSACAPAAPTAAPAQPTTAPTEAVAAPTATTAAPAEPTATTAAPAEPTATTAAEPTQAPAANAGWLDKIVFSAIADLEPAVAQLKAGTIDMYAVSNDDANVYEQVKADASLKYANVYGSSDQMLMNTVDCTSKGILNPFSNMAIREAMNWAIDRNYVVQEFLGGLGQPKFSPFTGAFPDAARNAAVFGAVATKYAYNLDKAKEVVDAEMAKMGATAGSDGKWQYKGKPVVVVSLIRTEDKRKEIGNYFADQLEKLGFTVDRQEKTRSEAAPIWQGEPTDCKFSVYTAGWISTSITRDEGLNFVQYNTGKVQGLPVMNAYQPSKELEAVEEPLFTNSFKTMDERAQLFQQAMDLSMKESWWGVWVVDISSYEPYSSKVSGAYDLAGGFATSQLLPYTLAKEGSKELHIAQSGILVQPWNPIQGSNWVDDGMVQHQTMDWGVIANPYTGLFMPKTVAKGDLTVKTGLPVSKTLDWVTLTTADEITVPDDAWADWDATNQKWITAAEKAKADPKFKLTANTKSVVTYKPELFQTKWHDGSNMSVADFVLYNIIVNFDLGKKESKLYDENYAATIETFLSHFKGWKITSTDPLTIETYDDQFALDAENNINSWYPSSVNYGQGAFENLAAAVMAEADGKLAFTTDKAQAKKVEWTSFISGPALDILSSYLDKAATSGDLPYANTMSQFIKPDEAKARYANLQTFFKAKKHMWLGTGPYMVDQVFPVEGSITLVPFPDYTGKPGEFSGFGAPMIATASVDGPTQLKAGDEGAFTVTVDNGDQPYPSDQIDAVTFTVFNAKGDQIGTGEGKMSAEGQYDITLPADITSKLEAGPSKLVVAVTSKAVSLPTFVTYEFVGVK